MPSSVTDRFTVDFEKIYFFVKNKRYWFEQQYETISEASANDRRLNKGGFEYNGKFKNAMSYPGFCGVNKKDRNKRAVWIINTKPFKESHFAVFPPELVETPLKAGCPKDGIVMDIFSGSGTVGLMAEKLGYHWVGIELNKEYCEMSKNRIKTEADQIKMKLV
jgi:site-specific DNA-methyltransferase (adenine-specific)